MAFEDSRTGVQSAAAAGITTVGIRTSLSDAELTQAGAVATAKDFDDPGLARLIAAKMDW